MDGREVPGADLISREIHGTLVLTENYLASGFATRRAVLINSSASGLSVRFLNVAITTALRTLGNSTGNALSKEYLLGEINV
jgi:hypothetical protein